MSDPRLTARQDEVLRAIARTGTAAMAARELGITESTAKVHRYEAYLRLGVNTQREAWIALGWMRLPDGR